MWLADLARTEHDLIIDPYDNKLSDYNLASKCVENRTSLNQSQSRIM